MKHFELSPREIEIVNEVAKGKTNQQIADEKSISLNTVKTHLKNVFQKTNSRNRVELTIKVQNRIIN